MTIETFLLKDAQAGKPLVVSNVDDSIYYLQTNKEAADFFETNGYRASLVKYFCLKEKENSEIDKENIKKRGEDIARQKNSFLEKKHERQSKEDHILLLRFLNFALYNWIPTGIVLGESAKNESMEDSAKTKKSVSNFYLNAGENKSVLTRTLAKEASLLFMCDCCFKLVKQKRKPLNKEVVQLHGEYYAPEYLCSIKEFNDRYSKEIEIALKRKIDEFYTQEFKELENLKNEEKELNTLLNKTQNENNTFGIGWIKLKNKYFLYQKRDPEINKGYYSMQHKGSKKSYGWFPPCTMGFEVIAENNKLRYVVDEAYSNIKILSPRPYHHPAVQRANNPFLCTKGFDQNRKMYNYEAIDEQFEWSQRFDLLGAIAKSISDAQIRIETGLFDDLTNEKDTSSKIGNRATVYKKIWKEFKKYENNKMPIGWADNTLDWSLK